MRVRRSGLFLTLATSVFLAACGSATSSEPDDAAPATTTIEQTEPTDTPTKDTAATADDATTSESEADDAFPSVIGAAATPDGDGTWRFDVTISSPYDTPERYADAWRVLGPDGNEYGIRILAHDHASEQPFTRSQSGIAIPADVEIVTIQGRDLANGWGGATFELTLPEDDQ